MPDIFEFSCLGRDYSDKNIEKYCSDGDELSLLISSIIRDPALRKDFIFASDYYEHDILPDAQEKRNKQKEVWRTFPQPLVRKVMLMSLTKSEQMLGIIIRIEKNLNNNHDWTKYLPPSDESFYSVLGVSEEIVTLPKNELESTLRSQYRTLDRTPVVNLAYSVLKNPGLREEYIWMYVNYDFHIILDGLESLEDEEEDEYDDDFEYDDDGDDFFGGMSPEEVLALLRKLKMGR